MSIYSEFINKNPELYSDETELYPSRLLGIERNGKNLNEIFEEIISSRYSEYKKRKMFYELSEEQKMFFIVNSENWRNKIKPSLIKLINDTKDVFLKTKNTKIDFYDFYSCYKSYKALLIDSWIEMVENNNLENETIDELFLFYDILYKNKSFLNEIAIYEKNEFELQNDREIFDELRYWNNSNNVYHEGGGGQEWSDSSDFL